MSKFSKTIQFGSGLSVAAVLLLVSGCRSTTASSVRNNNPNLEPVPTAPSAPFFRSYERSPRPYNEEREPLLPPMPPTEVPPVPGYTEPELVPPSPTSQKRRRPWIPSAKKPKSDSDDPSVDQIGARVSGQGSRSNQGKPQRDATVAPNDFPQLKSLPVPLPQSNDSAAIERWSPAATGASELGQPVHSRIDDVQSVNALSRVPVRSGTIAPWPESHTRALPRQAANDVTASRGVKPNLLPVDP